MKIIKILLKLQKIILLTFCFFVVTSNVSAYQNTFINPEISFLGDNENIGTASQNDYILDNQASVTRFCQSVFGTYVSHTSTNYSNVAEYINGQWDVVPSTTAVGDLVCNMSSNTTTPSTLTGSMLFMNFNPSSGDYEISEDFLIGLIIRLVLGLMFFTLMWKFSSFFWKLGSSISPYIKLGKK